MNALRLTLRLLLPLLIIGAGAFGAKVLINLRVDAKTAPPDQRLPRVGVMTVEARDLRLVVHAQGTVVPRTQSQLVAEIAGRVDWVSAALSSGGFFEQGEELLRIDARDYELALVQSDLESARAERALAEVEAQSEVARSDWERLGTGEGSPLVLRVPQLAEARAALAAAEAQRERAQRDVERCSVRAPYAGRVRAKLADEGQYVGRGSALAQLYAVDRAEVRLPLADDELAYLDLPLAFRGAAEPAPGPPVLLRARFAGAEHVWEGRVVRTEGELDPESRMLIAVVEVQDPYGRGGEESRPPLSVGMFVRAEILGREVAQAIVLPRAALRDANQVLVVDADDRLGLRNIEVLRAERDVLVLRGGLSAGERVVTTPLDVVIEGMQVSVEDATPNAAGER